MTCSKTNLLAAFVAAAFAVVAPALAEMSQPASEQPLEAVLARLIAAYPEALERIDGPDLVWRDGTRMTIDNGRPRAASEDDLDSASIKDMLAEPYPAGRPLGPPPSGSDPGRARNDPFFVKLYGDCHAGAVEPHLIGVPWLRKHGGRYVKVTSLQGVAAHLQAVSERLDRLPPQFMAYLLPPAGGYACRKIAGSGRRSAHGYGIAIDVALKHAHYWRWQRAEGHRMLPYHNEIPTEIVAAFEAEGFIWGGRWSHYDTMHFEYRPELFDARSEGPK